jgi:hypothetical protein
VAPVPSQVVTVRLRPGRAPVPVAPTRAVATRAETAMVVPVRVKPTRAVQVPAAKAESGAAFPPTAAIPTPAAPMGWPVRPDSAVSGQPSGRFRTASLQPRVAEAAPAFVHAGWSRAAELRSRHGSAVTAGPRGGSAKAGGAAANPTAPPSAAIPSAAWPDSYRRRSKNTPCSPNRLASREKRRHGARRPPSSAASQRSTT